MVSVLVLTYNQEALVVDTIAALLQQDYKLPLEVIIQDDCSKDNTCVAIKNYLSERTIPENVKIEVLSNASNKGIVGNLNVGVSKCSGDIIIINAGDDISLPNRVSAIVSAFENNRCSLVYHNATMVNPAGKKLGNLYTPRHSPISLKDGVAQGRFKVAGAVISFRKEIFLKFGALNENLFNEDDNLPIRALLLEGLYYLDTVLMNYLISENSASSWLWKLKTSEWRTRKILNIDNEILHRQEWLRHVQLNSLPNNDNLEILTRHIKRQLESLGLLKEFLTSEWTIQSTFVAALNNRYGPSISRTSILLGPKLYCYKERFNHVLRKKVKGLFGFFN